MKSKRMVHLECARGIASIIVVVHHFALAFTPSIKKMAWEGGLRYTPLYWLLNGDGAVIFFFVLSGFVLSLSFYKHFSTERLVSATLKRLPRLMVPAGASIFLGLVVLTSTGSSYLRASEFSESGWLRDYGFAHLPPDLAPSVFDAARQSLFVFLHSNDFYYNSNLWTMVDEFYGSLLVFAIVALFGLAGVRSMRSIAIVHGILAAVFVVLHGAFVAFVAGSFLAFWWTHHAQDFRIKNGPSALLLFVAACAYCSNIGAANILASLAVMAVLLGNESVAARLSNRTGELLGIYSFPLYLVHTLVILSASSFVFANLTSQQVAQPLVLLATFVVTIVVSALASWPFVRLDDIWVAWLNPRAKALVRQLMLGTNVRTNK